MPGVSRAGARPAVVARAACLLAACLLAACADPAPRATQDAEPAAATATLSCLPGTLVSLQLPLREGFAFTHAAPRGSDAVARCVLSLFGPRTLKSPLAFDRAYGRVFAYHEEGGTLDLHALEPGQLRLFRIGSSGAADVWLLRADIGTPFEPAHLDVLFSTRRGDGTLVDHLLVGAMGMLYRRDYDIETARAFAIHEETGRGAMAGPGYRARYRVQDDGRFVLVDSDVLPATAALP
ncbi:hypothetical protein [uncultured Luteimonas sp.]|uniref:hypothetical protein n=1 Tax=uncultured Luteimonas sp. TaxID=453144 RepID=UPI0026170F89|nr:hypothetical protein [uncultured Luteimonas sp.]